MSLQASKNIESMVLQLQDLLHKISYPGDNDRHTSYYIEEAEELANDILTEQEKISKLFNHQ